MKLLFAVLWKASTCQPDLQARKSGIDQRLQNLTCPVAQNPNQTGKVGTSAKKLLEIVAETSPQIIYIKN